jgi:hypothetical protein
LSPSVPGRDAPNGSIIRAFAPERKTPLLYRKQYKNSLGGTLAGLPEAQDAPLLICFVSALSFEL